MLAHAELVGAAEILRAGDDVAAIADAVAEMDVERRGDDRGANEQKREQRAERDRHALDEAPDAARVLARERGRICRGSPAVAGDPEDHRARDHERDPGVAVRPERCPRQHGDERDGDEAEADQRPGPIAAVAQGGRGEGILLPLVGHHEGRRQVDQDARAAEQREDDEADAVDGRVDVEVAREPAADAGELAIRATALQALRRSITECVGAGFCHVSSLSGRGPFRYPE